MAVRGYIRASKKRKGYFSDKAFVKLLSEKIAALYEEKGMTTIRPEFFDAGSEIGIRAVSESCLKIYKKALRETFREHEG
jgi:hypothetical protein